MFTFVAFSLKRAWEGFWRNALMSLAATATMVLMLLLLAGFWILQAGLQAGLEYTESKVEVVADLKDTATPADVTAIEDRLHLMPEVKDVHYVSREDALAIYRARLAEQGETDLTRYLDANPLHASLEVKLVDPKVFGDVVEKLRAEPAVDKVKEQQKTVDSLLTITNVLRTAGTVILIVIALIVLFIIVNTIRLAVVARAEEIEIMRLVGASDAFIRWPFVFEGIFVGVLGAVVTLLLLAIAYQPLSEVMFALFQVLPLRFGEFVLRDVALVVLGAGIALGGLGSYVSVRSYLGR
jgi:cell division transport system permease protein